MKNNDNESQRSVYLKAIRVSWIYSQIFLVVWNAWSLFVSKELPIVPFLLLTTSSLVVEISKSILLKSSKE